jgi:hypothetical protein
MNSALRRRRELPLGILSEHRYIPFEPGGHIARQDSKLIGRNSGANTVLFVGVRQLIYVLPSHFRTGRIKIGNQEGRKADVSVVVTKRYGDRRTEFGESDSISAARFATSEKVPATLMGSLPFKAAASFSVCVLIIAIFATTPSGPKSTPVATPPQP